MLHSLTVLPHFSLANFFHGSGEGAVRGWPLEERKKVLRKAQAIVAKVRRVVCTCPVVDNSAACYLKPDA